MVGEEMGRLRILWPRWLNRNDWPCGAQYVANVTAGRWWHKMHVSSAFVLQGKGRYSGMSISWETKCLCITASKCKPQRASFLRICHNLMFICGIYFKNIQRVTEKLLFCYVKPSLLSAMGCIQCLSPSQLPWDRAARLMVCLQWGCSSHSCSNHAAMSIFFFLSFLPLFQDTMSRVRCWRRGWGGRVVTFYRRFMTTSQSCTRTLKRTALTQVRLGCDVWLAR